MLDPNERKRLENAMKVNKVIWFVIFISLFIYVAICHIQEQEMHGVTDIGDAMRPLTLALIGVSVLIFGLIPLIRKIMFRFPSMSGMLGPVPKTPEATFTVALIVSLALAESIAIYGLVLFLLGASFEILYLFVGGSALTMLIYRPRMEALEALAITMKEHAQRIAGMS